MSVVLAYKNFAANRNISQPRPGVEHRKGLDAAKAFKTVYKFGPF